MGILDGIVEWIAEQVMAGLGLDNHLGFGGTGLRYGGISALLSRSRNDVQRFCGTGHRYHSP